MSLIDVAIHQTVSARLPFTTEHSIHGFFGEFRWLSNSHEVPVVLDGVCYPSAEHAFVGCKVQDLQSRRQVAGLSSPAQAKRWGQSVTLRPGWEHLRLREMYRVEVAKYTQNPVLAAQLLATGLRYLEEANDWNDKFWGVCLGNGLNLLGKTLMQVREELRMGRLIIAGAAQGQAALL